MNLNTGRPGEAEAIEAAVAAIGVDDDEHHFTVGAVVAAAYPHIARALADKIEEHAASNHDADSRGACAQ
jgi:hypothetical protein